MKKFICILLSIILTIILMILSINIGIHDMLIKTFSNSIVKEEINNVIDNIKIDNVNEEKISEIKEKIKNNKDIENMISKYFEAIINNENIDIAYDINNILEENKDVLKEYGYTEENIDNLKEEIQNSNINQTYNEIKNNINNDTDNKITVILNIYNFLKSNTLRYILLISSILICIVIALVQKSISKMLLYISLPLLISGILLTFGLVNIIGLVSTYITNNTSATALNINTSLFKTVGYTYIIIGIILTIIYIVIKKAKKKSL